MKKLLVILLTMFMMVGCTSNNTQEEVIEETSSSKLAKEYNAKVITLNENSATIDGKEIETFDYMWHVDPSINHDEVKNAPAEYYTGTKPDTDAEAYIDHELYYFPKLDVNSFKLVNYDGENEWAYYYNDGVNDEYIFASLPSFLSGNAVPEDMMHSEEEAALNYVLHIREPGNYILEGKWNGQIHIDLGDKDETFLDKNAKINIILNNVDITCTVAPGIIFYSAYEVDNTWEDKEEHSYLVDTTNAGVTVTLAKDSNNYVCGTNVYRMLKTKYKDEDDNSRSVKLQKKQRKIDAAFYSYVSMNIEGEGNLSIDSGFEGLDSELHLTIKGGNITINSQDDGINVNEDNVSIVSILGGDITINAGLGIEGDGIDSNGFVYLNGGTLNINNIKMPDSAIDSEDGIYYDGGTVIIDGETQTYEAGSSFNETGRNFPGFNKGDRPEDMNGRNPQMNMPNMNMFNVDFDLEDFKKKVQELPDDATIEDVLKLLGVNWGFDFSQPGNIPNGPQAPEA